ncbi:MAG: bifunctional adenosylcobinamide kinase/adenosylcobinamide-phosphate guanylyltransferase [Saccharospirillum sp.]|nr:bifunctional adenosylcobinamide kinase/adenosylcobinamide-phosphate guanylyltransferase [Saccharospirillum sp.]
MPIHLILGGARSGKSRFAEQTALARSGPHFYLATAQAGDQEMAERIAHHRAYRDDRFVTVACENALTAALAQCNQSEATVVVDCLTLWVTQQLSQNTEEWKTERAALLAQLENMNAHCLLVSNEVGQGIVPMGALSRQFVDETGWLHQDIAQLAQAVTLITAGLPLKLK